MSDCSLGCLLSRQIVSLSAFMATLYSMRGGEIPGPKTVEVLLHHVRQKVRPHGITIHNRSRQGWYINRADRERLRGQLLSDGA